MIKEIDLPQVHQICAENQIEIQDLIPITGSFGKKIFIINQAFLLRVSNTTMAPEQEKFRRIAALDFVPKIIRTGSIRHEAGPLYYTLLTHLPGNDLIHAAPQVTSPQQEQLGKDLARFLEHLHQINGPHYDIGLYVPVLPGFSGTWRAGHQKYWDYLEQESEKLPLKPGSTQVFSSAFRFLHAAAASLESQQGPKLLHNDLHPQNILVNQGRFSGVIDWECSQFGEADFDLCHLIHWCLFPPQSGIDFRPFLRALFAAAPTCTRVLRLAQRLTIYQIEHEIQQIIWNSSQAESWRIPRLIRWIDGAVEDLFREFTLP